MVAPLTIGATRVLDARPLDPGRRYRILADRRVSVWYTTLTAIRMLKRLGSPVGRESTIEAQVDSPKLSTLDGCASVLSSSPNPRLEIAVEMTGTGH